MASTRVLPIAVLVLAALLACSSSHNGVHAQSLAPEGAGAGAPEGAGARAPSPTTAGDGCFTALTNMSDCLTYVEAGSKLSKPDKGCCPELAGLVDSNPICLCTLLGNPDSIGIKIDLNKATKLPSVCGVDTPPVSTCSAIGVPVSLPPGSEDSISPEGSATSPSNAAGIPTGGPSPSASTSEDKNGASGNGATALTFIVGLSTLIVSIFF